MCLKSLFRRGVKPVAECIDVPDQVTAAVDPSPTKQDAGVKTPAYRGLAANFAHALLAVADVSREGLHKYPTYEGWKQTPNGIPVYADALLRHVLAYAGGELVDPESGLSHLAHAAWNALAILELERANGC